MDGQVQDLTWDDGTGELVVGPLCVSTDRVGAITFLYSRVVTFSTRLYDSRLVVSGSGDKTIRIWDVEAHKMLVEPLSG